MSLAALSRRSALLFFVVGLALTGLGLFSPVAHADGTLTPAFGCHAVNGRGQESIQHMAWGITNNSDDVLNVICAVSRPAGAGATVYVNGTVDAGIPMTCALLSITYNGDILASKSFAVTGLPNMKETRFDKNISLSTSEAPYYSYQTLYCQLPSHRRGALRGFMIFTN